MLSVLVKKQLAEVFRQYFYNEKKQQKRSKGGVIAYFVFFALLMIGLLGGMMTGLSLSLCGPLASVDMDWLYFALMSSLAIVFGAFGSVFNTYQGLYLAKDNDLLLSMPIPVGYIIVSRVLNVYLIGSMYSLVVILPAIIVYWIVMGATLARVVCGLLFAFLLTMIVLILSVVLGWVVAKVSLKLKNKGFMTVVLSLVFIAAYYFVYFKANSFIQGFILHAAEYGAKIKGAAYGIYMFGSAATGNWLNTAICVAVLAVISFLVWRLLSRSFVSLATSTGAVKKVEYVEKAARERSAFGAMLSKEFSRFTSSATYMLNGGLGILFIPAVGIALLINGGGILDMLSGVFAGSKATYVLLCGGLCLMCSMNTMASVSVSLEGKSIWIPQSLPIEAKTVLRAKTFMHMLLTVIPMLISIICAAVVVAPRVSAAELVLICIQPLVYAAFSAEFSALLGIKLPNLTWTNELTPIKQGAAILISIFGSWGIAALFAVPYFALGGDTDLCLYLGLSIAVFALAGVLIQLWMDKQGAKDFASL